MSRRLADFVAGALAACALWFLDVQGRKTAETIRVEIARARGRIEGGLDFQRTAGEAGFRQRRGGRP